MSRSGGCSGERATSTNCLPRTCVVRSPTQSIMLSWGWWAGRRNPAWIRCLRHCRGVAFNGRLDATQDANTQGAGGARAVGCSRMAGLRSGVRMSGFGKQARTWTPRGPIRCGMGSPCTDLDETWPCSTQRAETNLVVALPGLCGPNNPNVLRFWKDTNSRNYEHVGVANRS